MMLLLLLMFLMLLLLMQLLLVLLLLLENALSPVVATLLTPGAPTARLVDPAVLDRWGNPYVFAVLDGGVSITSLGADGALGGEGEDADIVEVVRGPGAGTDEK